MGGVPQDHIIHWLGAKCSRRPGDVDVHDFMTREPFKGIAEYSGLDSKSKILDLFFSIANPPNEDAIVERVSFTQLSAWMAKLLAQGSGGEEEDAVEEVSYPETASVFGNTASSWLMPVAESTKLLTQSAKS